jgi:hypothetical protein
MGARPSGLQDLPLKDSDCDGFDDFVFPRRFGAPHAVILYAKLSRRRLKRGMFRSLDGLNAAENGLSIDFATHGRKRAPRQQPMGEPKKYASTLDGGVVVVAPQGVVALPLVEAVRVEAVGVEAFLNLARVDEHAYVVE